MLHGWRKSNIPCEHSGLELKLGEERQAGQRHEVAIKPRRYKRAFADYGSMSSTSRLSTVKPCSVALLPGIINTTARLAYGADISHSYMAAGYRFTALGYGRSSCIRDGGARADRVGLGMRPGTAKGGRPRRQPREK